MSGDCAQPPDSAFQRLSRPERHPGVFVAGLAHELRTPLTILKGRLLGLRDGVIDPDAGECERLLAQVDRLMRLVDDLGTLTKAQAGRLTLDLRNVDLARIVDHLRRAVEGEAASAHVDLAIVAVAGTIRCDPIRLTQALVMLLRSALESISARRTAGCWQSEQVKLVLTVSASGAACASDDDDPWQIGLRPALAMALINSQGGKVTVTREGTGDEDLQILVALSAF